MEGIRTGDEGFGGCNATIIEMRYFMWMNCDGLERNELRVSIARTQERTGPSTLAVRNLMLSSERSVHPSGMPHAPSARTADSH